VGGFGDLLSAVLAHRILADSASRLPLVRHLCDEMHPKLVTLTDEAWFYLRRYVPKFSCQSTRCHYIALKHRRNFLRH
jgi:hypothetical protein